MSIRRIVFGSLLCVSGLLQANDITGVGKTIDDQTGYSRG